MKLRDNTIEKVVGAANEWLSLKSPVGVVENPFVVFVFFRVDRNNFVIVST